jgi:hypothetical protein
MPNNKITITDDIFKQAVKDSRPINEVMRGAYASEIAARVEANPAIKGLSPVHHAMFDAGLDLRSPVSAFYTRGENEYLFPALIETVLEEVRDDSPMLNKLVAASHTVPSRDIRTIQANFNTDKNRKAVELRDVAEGAELPRVMITTSGSTIRIYKRGLAVESTYEAIRDCAINMFLITLRQAMRRVAYIQIGDAIEVLVNGDGNKNAAPVSPVTPAAAIVAPEEIVDFMLDFEDASEGRSPNVYLTNLTVYKQLVKMFVPNNIENAYRPGSMFSFPQSNFRDIAVYYDKRVPQIEGKDIIIALDNTAAIDKYTVANSVINEFDRNIVSQKKIGTISEETGFGKGVLEASRIMKMK